VRVAQESRGKYLFFCGAFLFCLLHQTPAAHAQTTELPFQGLSSQEVATLESGHPVIRKAVTANSLSLSESGEFPDEIRNRVRRLRANYVGEVLLSLPAGKVPAVVFFNLAQDLSNVEGYVGIPYWSHESQRYYDLFDKMIVVSRDKYDAGEKILVDQHMEPFEDYRARYSYTLKAKELRFTSENLTPIIYHGFRAVAPGNMVWFLFAFERDRMLYLYGVGAVRAFDLFGIFGERLRISFMGRIQAFFSYIYSKHSAKD
jgi:hypothetical protein